MITPNLGTSIVPLTFGVNLSMSATSITKATRVEETIGDHLRPYEIIVQLTPRTL